MNDKILTMALMMFLIIMGINSFLFMASTNMYDTEGHQLNIYLGIDDYSNDIQTNAQSIEIGTDTEFSSSLPATQQGITAVQRDGNPVGLATGADLAKLGIGVQLVLLKLATMFPIISPITSALIAFAFAIQGLAIAYLGSILIRGILGRIT